METFTLWPKAWSLPRLHSGSGGRAGPLSQEFQSAQAQTGQGQGYLLQSLWSML